MMRKIINGFLLFLAVLAMSSGMGWVGDTLLECINYGLHRTAIQPSLMESIAVIVAGLSLTAGGFSYIYRNRRNYIPVRSLGPGRPPVPHKILVFHLSPSNENPAHNQVEYDVAGGWWRINGVDLNKEEIDLAISEAGQWNWAQLLRAVNQHIEALECIYLIGSKGDRGSFAQIDKARQLLIPYVGATVKIERHKEAIDFEDLGELHQVIINTTRQFKQRNYHPREIIIDITGGFKVTSIAGALATLHLQDLEFEHVQTIDEHKVMAYNCITLSQSEVE